MRTKMSDEERKRRAKRRRQIKRGWEQRDFPATGEPYPSRLLDFGDYDRCPKAVIDHPVVDVLVPPDDYRKRKPPKIGSVANPLAECDSPNLRQPGFEEVLQHAAELKKVHEEVLAATQKPMATAAASVVSASPKQPDFNFTAEPEPVTQAKETISEYLAKIGRKGGLIGGKVKSKAKMLAARANAKLPRPRGRDRGISS